MKSVYLLVSLFLFVQCSTIKVSHDESSLNREDKTIQHILKKNKVEGENRNILYFTSGFNNEKIQVISDNKILYNELTTTIDQLGLANIQVIPNDQHIIINFNEYKFSPKNDDLIKYKFIYISKLINKKRYLIEYSNKNRVFM